MRTFAIALVLALALAVPALALDAEAELYEELGAPAVETAIPDSARLALGEGSLSVGSDALDALGRLGDYLRGQAGELVSGCARSAAVMGSCVMLLGVVSALYPGGAPGYIELGGVVVTALASFSDMDAFLRLGSRTLTELSEFSKVLMPVLAGAAAAGGAVVSSAARYAGAVLFIDVVLTALCALALPLLYIYAGSAVASAATGDGTMAAVSGLIKKLCTLSLSLCVTAFTLYLTITGVIADTAGALASRAAKTAISAALPVVGGIIADAAGTIVSAAALLRSSVGLFGIIVILAVCALPVLSLLARYILFKLAAAVCARLCTGRMSLLLEGLGSAYGLMMGMLGSAGAMLMISVIAGMKAVGAA